MPSDELERMSQIEEDAQAHLHSVKKALATLIDGYRNARESNHEAHARLNVENDRRRAQLEELEDRYAETRAKLERLQDDVWRLRKERDVALEQTAELRRKLRRAEGGASVNDVLNGSPSPSRGRPTGERKISASPPSERAASGDRKRRRASSSPPRQRPAAPRPAARSPASSAGRSPYRRDSRSPPRKLGGAGRDERPQQRVTKPRKTIGIFGLPRGTCREEIENACSRFGKVVSIQLVKNEHGKALFSFVEFEVLEDAIRAREDLHGSTVFGPACRTDYAFPHRGQERPN